MYIGDYLGRREIYSPDKLAIVDAGKTPALRLTYRELNRRVNKLARWLREVAGVRKGDRVAILAKDGVEHLEVFYACGKLGAIHTALNWRLHWQETLGILQNTTPKALVFGDDFKSAVQNILETEDGGRRTEKSPLPAGGVGGGHAVSGLPSPVLHLAHVDGSGFGASQPYAEAWKDMSDAPIGEETLVMEDIAALLFTGGTTGLPKGAMISHRQICWNTLNTVIHDLTHDDVYLNVFPLFHTGGLFTYLSSQITFGNTTILLRQFDPAQVLDLIQSEKVTVFAAVPTMYQMLTQAPNWASADLGRLRFCTSGGAPLPVPLVEQYTREKSIRFKQGFGMTEYGPGLFALPPEDAIRKAGSIGRPNFFVDVRVVDENNQPVGANQLGELCLKGPSGCSGYWNNPEATKAAFDAEGWFHTGDIVKHDEGWYFYVVDRKKDMFISGGENVYPTEIEAVLYRHEAVHMAAVFGVPDPKWGEVGMACVILRKGQSATEQDLIGHMQNFLARYKVPKRVVFVDEMPLAGAGKIVKRELRAKYGN